MATLILDAIESIEVRERDHFNEVRALHTLRRRLWGLANSVNNREAPYREMANKMTYVVFGADVNGPTRDIDMVACFFHWFGVSLCNYARLVGFIRGLQKGEFTRADLSDETKTKDRVIKKSIDAYVQKIPELEPVLIWRNKVLAHFAITDPLKGDNIATLDMSVVFPVSYVAPHYVAGWFQMTQSNSSGTHASELPEWSVTEVYEKIAPRFWPGLKAGVLPTSNTS
jgi:hypothetical protein